MDFTAFKVHLRSLMSSRGFSNLSFSEEVGIPAPTISRYLTGDRTPKLAYVVKIAHYFGVSIDWMLGFSDSKYDTLPNEMQDVVTRYSLATPDDRKVVQAVLHKYASDKE